MVHKVLGPPQLGVIHGSMLVLDVSSQGKEEKVSQCCSLYDIHPQHQHIAKVFAQPAAL